MKEEGEWNPNMSGDLKTTGNNNNNNNNNNNSNNNNNNNNYNNNNNNNNNGLRFLCGFRERILIFFKSVKDIF